jgi:hypothetical protein
MLNVSAPPRLDIPAPPPNTSLIGTFCRPNALSSLIGTFCRPNALSSLIGTFCRPNALSSLIGTFCRPNALSSLIGTFRQQEVLVNYHHAIATSYHSLRRVRGSMQGVVTFLTQPYIQRTCAWYPLKKVHLKVKKTTSPFTGWISHTTDYCGNLKEWVFH